MPGLDIVCLELWVRKAFLPKNSGGKSDKTVADNSKSKDNAADGDFVRRGNFGVVF